MQANVSPNMVSPLKNGKRFCTVYLRDRDTSSVAEDSGVSHETVQRVIHQLLGVAL